MFRVPYHMGEAESLLDRWCQEYVAIKGETKQKYVCKGANRSFMRGKKHLPLVGGSDSTCGEVVSKKNPA